ncbi:DUF2029 domain-containing protein [Pseudonocardiaceae bacterium YIM PH 21723]|nr:DUF2029 domain-containing protein [Pseudonocardiaceae bacterium YIM PH 21723]
MIGGALYWASQGALTDLVVYRGGAHDLVTTGDPYHYTSGKGLVFTYPVFSALLFTPLLVLPKFAAELLVTVGSVGLLTLVVRHLFPGGHWPIIAALVLISEPVRENLFLGQINVLLIAMVVVDFTVLRGTRWQGLLTGIATGIKITPALFVVYLLVTRQWRAVLTAGLGFLGTVAIGALAGLHATITYFGTLLLDAGRVGGIGFVSNQSVRGALTRLFGDSAGPAGAVLSLLGLVLAFRAAWQAHRRDEEILALLLVGAGGLLASPISWSHHWIWFALLLTFCLYPGRPRAVRIIAAIGGLVLLTGPMWLYANPHGAALAPGVLPAILASAYGLCAFALLAAMNLRSLMQLDPQ